MDRTTIVNHLMDAMMFAVESGHMTCLDSEQLAEIRKFLCDIDYEDNSTVSYKRGKSPKFEAGDIVMYEGDVSKAIINFGKVTNVSLNEVVDDWMYTFDDVLKNGKRTNGINVLEQTLKYISFETNLKMTTTKTETKDEQ